MNTQFIAVMSSSFFFFLQSFLTVNHRAVFRRITYPESFQIFHWVYENLFETFVHFTFGENINFHNMQRVVIIRQEKSKTNSNQFLPNYL